MESTEDEIARLERRLAELRAKRTNDEWEGPGNGRKHGQPFFVHDENDLALDAMPDLVRQILDALPVSVFVKVSQITPNRGRRFTYLNKLARDRKKWNATEIPERYDSEAFLNEWNSPLYHTMLVQETNTLDLKKSRYMQLEWQPGEDFWRRSKTLEVPIFGRGEVDERNPIGFCAIAEEVEFKMFPFIHSWLRRVFNHEYRNMTFGVKAEIESTIDFLSDLATAQSAPRRSDNGLSASTPGEAIQGLKNAMKLLTLHGRSYEELYDAFSPKSPNETRTVAEVLDSIKKVFEIAPFEVTFAIDEGAAGGSLKRWNVIKNVLLVLMGNAIKHADRGASPKAHINVYREEDKAVFAVRNRCQSPSAHMTLRTFEDRAQSDPSARNLSGTIIGELLSRAYPSPVWKEMLKESADGGWVQYALYCDTVEDQSNVK